MGGITSRISFNGLNPSRRRSQQEEPLYSYSLNKNYFSNYFLMGGERFEINNPDYLFGDSCDLNFLSCTKPYTLPYKEAQQNLLANLNSKQKASNKASSRVNVGITSPLNLLTGRNRQNSQCQKQDAQTQTLNNSSKGSSNGSEPSKPLIMMINIRKETLRLVKLSNFFNLDSDLNSLFKNQSPKRTTSTGMINEDLVDGQVNTHLETPSNNKLADATVLSPEKSRSINPSSSALNKDSQATLGTVRNEENGFPSKASHQAQQHKKKKFHDVETTSILSTPTSNCPSQADVDGSADESSGSSKTGYISVKDIPASSVSDDDDDNYEDALNDTTNLSLSKDETDEDQSERAQQQESLLRESLTKENRDKINTKIPISDDSNEDSGEESSVIITGMNRRHDGIGVMYSKRSSNRAQTPTKIGKKARKSEKRSSVEDQQHLDNRVYNIEFQFDAEVDCSIRIFYFCTREVTSKGVIYKPQHATYKSKSYTYKKGLNQKFEQQEHTFQPYLFDEDLLIYKPLDTDGNYNSGAVFPIVIHCVALDGAEPRQSQSLVATVDKSQLDESYSIKPLKQLIFADGVQYILQDIYGIENKTFPSQQPMMSTSTLTGSRTKRQVGRKNSEWSSNLNTSLRSSMISIGSNNPQQFSDTASIASGLVIGGGMLNDNTDENEEDTPDGKGSLLSVATITTNQQAFKSLVSENNSFECVICMSEERDTMLLPCRHLCLCSSCAQSLRYQASSCPICRCPFKAALNLRIVRFNGNKERRKRRQQDRDRT